MSEEEPSRKREREEEEEGEAGEAVEPLAKQSKADPDSSPAAAAAANEGEISTQSTENPGKGIGDDPPEGEEKAVSTESADGGDTEPAAEASAVEQPPTNDPPSAQETATVAASEAEKAPPENQAYQDPDSQTQTEEEAAPVDPAQSDQPSVAPVSTQPGDAEAPAAAAVVAGSTPVAAGTVPPPVENAVQSSPSGPPPEAAPAPVDPDTIVEEKGELSAFIAGRVIGKGGEVIRDLQARSGATIDVDAAPNGANRIVTYRGPRRKVEFAMQLVQMISNGMPDTDLPLGEATREVLLIPASATGKVIGRGGEMVREMQSRSQAKIDFDHAATADRPEQKQVVVTGTPDAVRKANEMIMFLVANPMLEAMQALNLLVNEKLASGQPWGSGPPYPNLPNAGSNMQPEMLGSYGSPGGYGPDAQYATAPPGHSSYGRAPYSGGSAPGGVGEEVIFAKKQFMGRIIGQKGVTINDLQRRSGTDIQINQAVPAGHDCEIRIRGSRDGIEMVKQMVREIIEIGPNHPYAGGGGGGAAGSYSGGYGGFSGAPYQGGAYNYGGPSYGYPPQQQTQGGYGYPPQGAAGGYGGIAQPAASYQNYGGYPSQEYGVSSSGYAGASASYSGGGYSAPAAGYPPSGYGQSSGYPPQQSSAPPAQQSYGGTAPYSQAPPSYPPVPAPASAWKTATSPDGQIYYYNAQTGETQWEKPAGFP